MGRFRNRISNQYAQQSSICTELSIVCHRAHQHLEDIGVGLELDERVELLKLMYDKEVSAYDDLLAQSNILAEENKRLKTIIEHKGKQQKSYLKFWKFLFCKPSN